MRAVVKVRQRHSVSMAAATVRQHHSVSMAVATAVLHGSLAPLDRLFSLNKINLSALQTNSQLGPTAQQSPVSASRMHSF